MTPKEYSEILATCDILGVDPMEFLVFHKGDKFVVTNGKHQLVGKVVLYLRELRTTNQLHWFIRPPGHQICLDVYEVIPFDPEGIHSDIADLSSSWANPGRPDPDKPW